MRFILLTLAALILPTTGIASCTGGAANTETTTVWLDAKFGFRKKSGASGINKTHKKMEAKGWCFNSMELYTENGDLEGFFVSYSREKRKLSTNTAEQTDKSPSRD